MKPALAIACLFLAACKPEPSPLVEVRVVSTHVSTSFGDTFSHMIVERVDTGERLWVSGQPKGKPGETFFLREENLK